MEKVYKVGIIGFGFMGRVRAYAYQNLKFFYQPAPLPVRLFGLCDSNRALLDRAAADFGFELVTTDFRELIEHPEIDIINICSPNLFHREQILAAIAAGKHIYCDKPLVCSAEEAAEIEAALAGYRGISQMAFNYRFFPATLRARELVDQGFLGQPIAFRVAYYHSGSVDPKKPMGWKQDRSFGGGVLYDMASHSIDMTCHLLGEYDRVLGSSLILYPNRPDAAGRPVAVQVEDHVVVTARMKKGGLGVVEGSKVATGSQDELKFEIYGTGGALRWNSIDPNFLDVFDQADPDVPLGGELGFKRVAAVSRYPAPFSGFPGPKFTVGWLMGHVQSLAAFLAAVRDRKPAEPSLSYGVYNIRVLEAVRRSEREGRWVEI